MADGFIVRRGGKGSEQALAPTITEVSKTETQIVFTIKNNDTSSAVILWEIGDTTPDANSLELAADTTSSNITVTGLTQNTAQVIYSTANVTGKVKSNVSQLTITTDAVIYTAATGGTTNEYNLDSKRYRSHTFTSSGNFEVTTVGDATDDRNKVDYLLIAGGGGGGSSRSTESFASGSGGGAGGYRTTLGTSGADSAARDKVTVTAQTYSIVIGAGGTGGADQTNTGTSGSASTGLGISTVGGGAGRSFLNTGQTGISGGSGGGGGSAGSGSSPGGTGTSLEGSNGGNGHIGGGAYGAGGGGGALSAGGNGSSSVAGNGGNGLGNILRTGSSETRAGGGGGSIYNNAGTAGTGGTGGGGNGAATSPNNGENATANTGSGGGGASSTGSVHSTGGNGAGGILVIRYEIAPTS
jgi:hypothetical protein